MKFVLLTSLLLIAGSPFAQGQRSDTIRVVLQHKLGNRDMVRSTIPTSTRAFDSVYTGMPTCEASRIGIAAINVYQLWYSEYVRGKRDRATFLKSVRDYGIDTTTLSRNFIKSYVGIFSGLKGSKKIVVVDSNNNHDFLDDTVYAFDTLTVEKRYRDDSLELAPTVLFRYEFFSNNRIVQKQTAVKLKPFDLAYSYPNKLTEKLQVYTLSYRQSQGTFSIRDTTFKVVIAPSVPGQLDDPRNFWIKIQKENLEYLREFPDRNGEALAVGGHLFRSVAYNPETNTLTLVYNGYDKRPNGGYVTDQIPDLTGTTLDSGTVSVKSFLKRNKYVLLDFWGSWCGPCLRSIPLAKKVYDAADRNKLEIIGVASEYKAADFAKSASIVRENNIKWLQIGELIEQDNARRFSHLLTIKSYPSYLLISPEGQVVSREVGEDGLRKLLETLTNLNIVDRRVD